MNQPNQTRLTKDGFLNVCLVGACPEVKKEGGLVLIRNSHDPKTFVSFTNEEFSEFKKAILNGIV